MLANWYLGLEIFSLLVELWWYVCVLNNDINLIVLSMLIVWYALWNMNSFIRMEEYGRPESLLMRGGNPIFPLWRMWNPNPDLSRLIRHQFRPNVTYYHPPLVPQSIDFWSCLKNETHQASGDVSSGVFLEKSTSLWINLI